MAMQQGGVFNPYPDIREPDFVDRIFWKKEFNRTMYGSDFQYSTTEDLCSRGEFRMQNHQEFVRNFISPETPYNGMLLFHGTGVGKTCAAIGITEGLRDYVSKSGKKIFVLSSSNVRPNFKKELHSEERETTEKEYHSIPGSYQCAGNRYYVEGYYPTAEAKKRAITKILSQYYEFMGYQQFANYVDIKLGADIPVGPDGKPLKKPSVFDQNGDIIDIGDYFNNSIIIIDEAHGIANPIKKGDAEDASDSDGSNSTSSDSEDGTTASTKGKRTKRKSRRKVVRAESIEEPDETLGPDEGDGENVRTKRAKAVISQRTLYNILMDDHPGREGIVRQVRKKGGKLKIILLTATPMKDDVDELANLLALLNANDGVDLKDDLTTKLFPRNIMQYDPADIAAAYDVDYLRQIAAGYISYVNADNTITFPKALLPDDQVTLYEPGHMRDPSSPDTGVIFPYRPKSKAKPGEVHITKYTNVFDQFNIKLGGGVRYFQFNLTKCPMDVYQFQGYMARLHELATVLNADGADTSTKMASNIIFPTVRTTRGLPSAEELLKMLGLQGFRSAFITATRELNTKGNAKHRHKFYRISEPIWQIYGNWLMLGQPKNTHNIGNFSAKLYDLVRAVNNSGGIAYVYSEFKECGAIITALALEANGYLRYIPELNTKISSHTGLPDASIQDKLPQSRLLHYTETQLQSMRDAGINPDHNYRCAYCGELYGDCTRDTDAELHQGKGFKVATYVIITGDTPGGINDIAAVTSNDNINGEKIKVVVGTRVTGQGVDFRWLRQVHILDPWHNNTRIYQAIGRGIRHCSHADLPPHKRNVMVFRYSSSTPELHESLGFPTTYQELVAQLQANPNYLDIEITDSEGTGMGFTFGDILTETVDEHMYQRVVKKDILIKHVERTLKEIAVDCELNRMRNQFTTPDEDFSRKCDFMKCEYKCAMKAPVHYIRRLIRRRLDGGEPSWELTNEDAIRIPAADIPDMFVGATGTNFFDIPEIQQDIEQTEPMTNNEVWDHYRKTAHKVVSFSEIPFNAEVNTNLLESGVIPQGLIAIRRFDKRDGEVVWSYVMNLDGRAKEVLGAFAHLFSVAENQQQEQGAEQPVLTEDAIWQTMLSGDDIKMVTTEELLLDLPFGTIDSSTYDIYFTEPQVDKATKIITRLFHQAQAMSLKKIMFLVKKANPLIDSKFIYVALNKLVGHPPFTKPLRVIDKFGRSGTIIFYNDFYVYQPNEIQDQRVPMHYRKTPITIKSEYYSMHELAQPAQQTGNTIAFTLDEAQLVELLEQFYRDYNAIPILSLIKLHIKLDMLLMMEHIYIFERALVDEYYYNQKEATEYLLEYYLRCGAAYFIPFEDDVGSITEALGRDYVGHVMSRNAQGHGVVRVRVPVNPEDITQGFEWQTHNSITELPDLYNHLGGNNMEKDYTAIQYPTVNMGRRSLYPDLNTLQQGEELAQDEIRIYGFLSKPPPTQRGTQKTDEDGLKIIDRIGRHYKEYQTHSDIGKMLFKLLDQERYIAKTTMTGRNNKRLTLRGEDCKTRPIPTNKATYERLLLVVNSYISYILGLITDLESFEHFVQLVVKHVPNVPCIQIEYMLRICDYFGLDDKKWFLNPIDVEFYRSSARAEIRQRIL